jgi:hypothetical protein
VGDEGIISFTLLSVEFLALILTKILKTKRHYVEVFYTNFTQIGNEIWKVSFRSPSLSYLLTVGVGVVYLHLITLRHTPQSIGLLWTRDRLVAETST